MFEVKVLPSAVRIYFNDTLRVYVTKDFLISYSGLGAKSLAVEIDDTRGCPDMFFSLSDIRVDVRIFMNRLTLSVPPDSGIPPATIARIEKHDISLQL